MAKTRTYHFPQGQHKSRPIVLDSAKPRRKVNTRVFKCTFFEDCIYKFLKDNQGTLHPNQWDFNKLRGNSHCFWDNHINSYMGAWRWNPLEVSFDLTSYFHINGERYISPGRVHFLERDKHNQSEALRVAGYDNLQQYKLMESVEVMAKVHPLEPFFYRLLTDWDSMQFGVGFKCANTEDIWVDDWTTMEQANKTTRDILHWFGGDFVAPHYMRIWEQKL